jgi:peptidoglycan/LPS O-acetylase OafA/YrhL
MVGGWFLLLPDEYAELGKHVAGGAGFVSNLMLWNERGYFDVTSATKPLLHLWSRGIEEQFYFAWPLILWAAWRIRLNILTVAAALIAWSFVANIHEIGGDPVGLLSAANARMGAADRSRAGLHAAELRAYMQLNFGTWFEPISGLTNQTLGRILFRGSTRTDDLTLRNLLSVSGAVLVFIGLKTITSATPFPGHAAEYPCFGAALIIAAGERAWINRFILSSKPLVWLGLISYPLYLWHWPLLSFGQIINGGPLHRGVNATLVLIAITLAALTYLFVERPLRASSFRLKVPALGAAVACVGALGFFTLGANGLPERPIVADEQAVNSQFTSKMWDYAQDETCLSRYQFPEAKSYGWWFCMASQDAPPEIMLIGTSFANHLYPGLVSEKNIGDKSTLSIGACGFDDTGIADKSVPTFSPCSGSRSLHQRELIDQIVAQGSVRYAIIDGTNPNQSPESIARVAERIDYLEAHGVKPIIFVPHIMTDGDLKGCFARPLKAPVRDCTVDLSVRRRYEVPFQPLIDAFAKIHPEVKFFNQNDLICGRKKCSFVLDGMPVFRDQYSHYSVFASDKLADMFVKWAKVNEPGILAPVSRSSVQLVKREVAPENWTVG